MAFSNIADEENSKRNPVAYHPSVPPIDESDIESVVSSKFLEEILAKAREVRCPRTTKKEKLNPLEEKSTSKQTTSKMSKLSVGNAKPKTIKEEHHAINRMDGNSRNQLCEDSNLNTLPNVTQSKVPKTSTKSYDDQLRFINSHRIKNSLNFLLVNKNLYLSQFKLLSAIEMRPSVPPSLLLSLITERNDLESVKQGIT